jgi:hypothetical protein
VSNSERILSEQRKQAEQYRHEHEEALARDRDRAALSVAWDGLRHLIKPDGRILPLYGGPAAVVRQLSLLYHHLDKRGLLPKLSEPPAGSTPEDIAAWTVAREILDLAQQPLDDTPPSEHPAARLLSRLPGLPIADKVRRWLAGADGFQRLVEDRWMEGQPLAGQLTPLPSAAEKNKDQLPYVANEEAAILRALLQVWPTQVPVSKLIRRVALCEKTIRGHLNELCERKLVKRPNKKGWTLTEAGQTLIKEMPPEAGKELLRRL